MGSATAIKFAWAVPVLLVACNSGSQVQMPSPGQQETSEIGTAAPANANHYTPTTTYAPFREAFLRNADCGELFVIRNEAIVDPDTEQDINEDLAAVGCFSDSSKREEPRGGGGDAYSISYKAAWITCSGGGGDTYEQADTDDPERAAAWLASDLAGERKVGTYDGCLDALSGRDSKFRI